ncbi:alpha-hydroxy acid oxidase [Pseudocolwellia agarivorans]|uniref:alpha-hydroxy acid oxidase n=1 Tax=Pseudocolwellia agarivorans TaxID=1911682 RepID=UPI0009851EC5|nr:alpha-hydroxy acid oxidase [Pseudocolwellia agarivorans]
MTQKSSFELRRRFLQFMAASPALYGFNVLGQSISSPYAPQHVQHAKDAVNVFDFHEVAKSKLSPGHYTYMARGSDHGLTQLANSEDFKKIKLRMRRLVDVRNIDTSIELFGKRYASPILLSPCGRQSIYHPEAELAVARAAKNKGAEFILSTVGSSAIEDVNQAAGKPIWFQLYPDTDWQVTQRLVKRVENSGCPVLVLTVDMPATNREALDRFHRSTNSECQSCHSPKAGVLGKKPMLEGLSQKSRGKGGAFMNWVFVERLKATTSMKIVLKGIVTHEDAKLALEYGVDGVIVSNHGGRAEDSGRSTIDCLPEVVAAIDGKIPVLFDGGIRRGTDVFKALALGADAVGIGQPYLWGLCSFGQSGVETVLDLLNRELEIVMKQARTTNIAQITPSYIA